MSLPQTFHKDINKLELINGWLDGQCKKEIGIDFNHRNDLVLIEITRLYLPKDRLPHFR
jgi:hypothetical protein